MKLKFISPDGIEVAIHIPSFSLLQDAFRMYCQRTGFAEQQVSFSFDGSPLDGSVTPPAASLEDNDIIQVSMTAAPPSAYDGIRPPPARSAPPPPVAEHSAMLHRLPQSHERSSVSNVLRGARARPAGADPPGLGPESEISALDARDSLSSLRRQPEFEPKEPLADRVATMRARLAAIEAEQLGAARLSSSDGADDAATWAHRTDALLQRFGGVAPFISERASGVPSDSGLVRGDGPTAPVIRTVPFAAQSRAPAVDPAAPHVPAPPPPPPPAPVPAARPPPPAARPAPAVTAPDASARLRTEGVPPPRVTAPASAAATATAPTPASPTAPREHVDERQLAVELVHDVRVC
jgi:hypothetical protein